MSSILEKLDSYQILTNLLPGAFFGMTLKIFFGLTLPTQNVGEDIVVYYFMGLIINRIGSLIVEPVLKKYRFIEYAPYHDFVKALKTDSKIDTLSEMNNYTRSLLTSVLLLPVNTDITSVVFKMDVVFFELEMGRYSISCCTVFIFLQEANQLCP